MRSSVGFNAPPPPPPPPTPSLPSPQRHDSQLSHSAWHSPVPYLFGGLAAMLGLISFALLILACSYWKLSGYLDAEGDADDRHDDGSSSSNGRGGDDGANKDSAAGTKPAPCFEQRIVVIMAGDVKPTFLATPISSRASSFGDNGSCSSDGGRGVDGDGDGDGTFGGKKVVGCGDQGVELGGTGNTTAEEDLERGNDQSSQRLEQ